MKRRLIIVGIILLSLVFWFSARVRPGIIQIPTGASISDVGLALAQNKIIVAPTVFKIGFKFFANSEHVYPGEVVVPEKCSLRCLVKLISSARINRQRVTITEGMDLRDIARLLEKNNVPGAADFYSYVGRPATERTQNIAERTQLEKINPFLKELPANLSLEGYLYPDTYELNTQEPIKNLVADMSRNFNQKISGEAAATIARSGHSLSAVIIVASILEKEVRADVDRKLVADILWRRLKIGMALQVDSSVQYVTGRGGRFTTSADRKLLSPWNTYKNPGLPEGPISNPGLESILAAATPAANDNWYYLTAPDGRVYYARTLAEQAANKKYLH